MKYAETLRNSHSLMANTAINSKQYRRNYYLANFERLSNYGKKWRLIHQGYMSNYCKNWRLIHPDYDKLRRYLKSTKLLGIPLWDKGMRPS